MTCAHILSAISCCTDGNLVLRARADTPVPVPATPSPRYRHIVFELFDTDLNHMIRSETRYDMTHRRWVLYQVRDRNCKLTGAWAGHSVQKRDFERDHFGHAFHVAARH